MTEEIHGDIVGMFLRYKRWADRIAYDSVAAIPEQEAYRERETTFGSIVRTLDHVRIVDDIFRHHLEGRRHDYRERRSAIAPALSELQIAAEALNGWFIDAFDRWSETDRRTVVTFEFIGGQRGAMSRAEIALHLVNHATYHRGFVGDMLKQVPFHWPANDLTVFLRDEYRRAAPRE